MKKNKSIKGIIQTLEKHRRTLKIPKKEFEKLFTPAGQLLVKEMALLIENHKYPEVLVYDLGIIDYERDCYESVRAGEFDDCEAVAALRVSKPKGESGKWRVVAHLHWYNQPKTKEEFLADILKKKLELGGFCHLLALAETYPEVQESYPVLEVRDSVTDRYGVRLPTLGHSPSGRTLSFISDTDIIARQYWLLAVSKEPAT